MAQPFAFAMEVMVRRFYIQVVGIAVLFQVDSAHDFIGPGYYLIAHVRRRFQVKYAPDHQPCGLVKGYCFTVSILCF